MNSLTASNGNTYPKVLIICIIFCLVLIESCSKDPVNLENKMAEDYNPDFLLSYYNHLCTIVKTTPGFFPPQASRAYGYIGIAAYESIINGIDGGQSLQNQLNEFSSYKLPQPIDGEKYNWAIASNAAVSKMMKYMFDKNLTSATRFTIDSLETVFHKQLSDKVDLSTSERSRLFGQKISDVIYEYSKTDGGHESYLEPFQLPYSIPTDAYCWVPTSSLQTPLCPKWGKNRSFLKNNVLLTQAGPHVPYSESKTSEFYNQALATYNQVKNNTSEEVEIAMYWSDDPFNTCTPTGHTFNILAQILKEENATLAKTTVGLAKMSIAENDAFIACWKGKYDYVLLRPITYIQKHIDPSFTTLLGTPPFPTYTSGHSCEMGAGSRILTSLFTNGSGNYLFTDYSQLQYGFFARSYSNFDKMADECANSRLYGGIHFPMDNSKGLQVGKAIGDNVNKDIKWPSVN